MAKEDYVTADRVHETADGSVITAGEKVEQTVQETPDADTRAAADAAGVSDPAHIDYAAALERHQSRSDIETLADRRAREYGSDFDAGEFMRRTAYNADGTVKDAPRPGTIHGDAPKSE